MFAKFRFFVFALLGAAFAVTAIAQPAPSPLAQAAAVSNARKVDYAYDYQIDSSKQNWRAHYDPAGAAPHLRLVDPHRETLPAGEQRAFDNLARRTTGISWCASDNLARATDLRLLREDAETAVYGFQPTANGQNGGATAAFSRHMRGEATLTKINPDVVAVRFFIPQPFSPIPLTRLERLEVNVRCDLAPNGRRYAAETVLVIAGSGLGQNINERSVTRQSNLRTP